MNVLRSIARAVFNPPPTVAVIKLQGMISARPGQPRGPGISLDKVSGWIDSAFRKRRNLRAVALAINSPGGSPVQSELVAQYIRAKAKETGLPVWAFAEDVAASGGYWLMCAADKGRLFACKTSVVGSIGVISQSFGVVDVLKRVGVESRRLTAGKNKGMNDPFQPVNPEDQERLRGLLESLHTSFKEAVIESRGSALSGEPEKIFTGEAFTGTQALELGLIDGLGDMHSILKEEYGPQVRLRRVNPMLRMPPFPQLFSGSVWDGAAGGLAAGVAQDAAAAVIEELSEREIRARYGASGM